MNQKEQFVVCVQTAAIVRDIVEGYRQAARIVGYACELSDDEIAERIEKSDGSPGDASEEFVSEETGH